MNDSKNLNVGNILTPLKVAEALNTNIDTVRRLCSKGELKAYKRLKKWYILEPDLVEYIKAGNCSQ